MNHEKKRELYQRYSEGDFIKFTNTSIDTSWIVVENGELEKDCVVKIIEKKPYPKHPNRFIIGRMVDSIGDVDVQNYPQERDSNPLKKHEANRNNDLLDGHM